MLTSLAYRRHIPPQMLQAHACHLYHVVPMQPAVRRHVAHPRRVRDMDSVMLVDPFGQGTEISAGIQVIDMAARKECVPLGDEGDAVVRYMDTNAFAQVVDDDGLLRLGIVERSAMYPRPIASVLGKRFGTVRARQPRAVGGLPSYAPPYRSGRRPYWVSYSFSHHINHLDRGHLAHVLTGISHLPLAAAYPFPVDHAEIGVLPRTAVDDAAVVGDAASRIPVVKSSSL